MSYTRKTVCAAPGCNGYAIKSSKFCAEHAVKPNRDTTSKFASYYKTKTWIDLRKRFLLQHVYCEECLKRGVYTPATTVHHSQGFNDWQSFIDVDKYVALCSSCHSRIHQNMTNEELYKLHQGG